MEYLSGGITESTINSISQLPEIRVMARGTVFSYKGKTVDPRVVGRGLNVDAVVSGSIRQYGETLVIRADLVHASDGSQIWGQQYSHKMTDILAMQSEITREISAQFKSNLSSGEIARMGQQLSLSSHSRSPYCRSKCAGAIGFRNPS